MNTINTEEEKAARNQTKRPETDAQENNIPIEVIAIIE